MSKSNKLSPGRGCLGGFEDNNCQKKEIKMSKSNKLSPGRGCLGGWRIQQNLRKAGNATSSTTPSGLRIIIWSN